MYTIYTKEACPFCIQAKMLLKRKSIQFIEIKCDDDIEYYRKLIREELGMKTFPVIVKDDEIIGSFTQLAENFK